ncbi:hypothetical protein T492DRAFT_846937 [Pavlovales sp. CCMP2436]|nr:hypothetical protein T492DRAFT_846937 [Pavlovales sp. CCMP2436]
MQATASAEETDSAPQSTFSKSLTRSYSKAVGNSKTPYVDRAGSSNAVGDHKSPSLVKGDSAEEVFESTLVTAQDAANPTEAPSLLLPLSSVVSVVTRRGEMVGFFVAVPNQTATPSPPAAGSFLAGVLQDGSRASGSFLAGVLQDGSREAQPRETAGLGAAAAARTAPPGPRRPSLTVGAHAAAESHADPPSSRRASTSSAASDSEDKLDPVSSLLRAHLKATAADMAYRLARAASSSRPVSQADSEASSRANSFNKDNAIAGKDGKANQHAGAEVVGDEIAHARRGMAHPITHAHIGMHLSTDDAPPAGCPALRFVQVHRVNASASLTAKQLASLGMPAKAAEALAISARGGNGGKRRELLVRTPAEAAAKLRAALDVAGEVDGVLVADHRTLVEAYARISEHELTWAALWASKPKVWRVRFACGLQLLLAAGVLVVEILYSFTDSKLAYIDA